MVSENQERRKHFEYAVVECRIDKHGRDKAKC